MAATSTTGLVGASTRCSSHAVSSSVSVPWVTTSPATSGRARWWATRPAKACQVLLSMSLLSSWATCSASMGVPASAGTAASKSATERCPAR